MLHKRARTLKPDFAEAHNNLGNALLQQDKIDDAVVHLERALVLMPDFVAAHYNLGIALSRKDRSEEAKAHYERALILNPDYANAHNNLGNLFVEEGKFPQAIASFQRAIALKPTHAQAHLNRAAIKTFQRGGADMAALEALAADGDLPEDNAIYIHFALAKALDDIGDYVRGFEHLRRGNALKRRQINYDETSELKLFQRIAAVFDRSLIDRLQGLGDPSPTPIFVLGMPRSGSTLIEQVLASHPQIHAAGELTILEMMEASGELSSEDPPLPYPESAPVLDGNSLRALSRSYLSRLPSVANGEVRIVDKLSGNFLRVGLIRLILPSAKIVHVRRDPLDTCLSCFSKLFTYGLHYSYDLAELGRYYRAYTELMAHWRSILSPGTMFEVVYEDLVNDLEGEARRLIDYCGLPWDDRCLGFHKTSRRVKTASSFQIHQPLFRSSLQRWRHYEAGLGPLVDELKSVCLV
jgi:tetratricopeptide (TPR) repeat protein